jgi:hypothetical protein
MFAIHPNPLDSLEKIIALNYFKVIQIAIQSLAGWEFPAKGNNLGHNAIVRFGLQIFEIIAQAFYNNPKQGLGGHAGQVGIFGKSCHFAQQVNIIFFVVTIF